jgi:uncharacterized damage-inducible protein DinB
MRFSGCTNTTAGLTIEFCKRLPPLTAEQFTRDLGGSFRAVRGHAGAHLQGRVDLRKRRDALFNPDAFPTVAALQLKWAEIEKEQSKFVNRATNESLGNLLSFRQTQVRLAHLIQHLANHSTYHRGQIALMMRQLEAEPLATDFHVFLVESRETAAAR